MIPSIQLLYLSVLSYFIIALGWNEWLYNTTWSSISAQDFRSKKTQWYATWSTNLYRGSAAPPRPRYGHSLHYIKTDPRSDYKGATYLVMFGGRDNDQITVHIPKTYNVQTINGSVEFTTYDEKPVSPCNDPNNTYYSPSEQTNCNFTTASKINVALIYNDVWAYKICNQQTGERNFDEACEENGWELWHPGALQGGCLIELGSVVCTVPSERYYHASALFDDGCLYVYGGFSERCEDFCDDIWFFDIYLRSWREVYPAGKLTRFYTDAFFGEIIKLNRSDVPISNGTAKFAGPGKRWRHSMVIGEAYYDAKEGYYKQDVAVFGGHRLWHGYSQENSQDNNWEQYDSLPTGGYLKDLWVYTKYLDFNIPGLTYKTNNGRWKLRNVAEQCFATPGLSWESRNLESCTTIQPVGRAGHGSAYDYNRSIIWIFGGYSTYYPYPSTDGIGSGPGPTSVGSGGFIPYPGFEYFRNDLWYYNLSSSLWVEVELMEDSDIPDPRVDMIFLLLGDILFVHGGYGNNYIYEDTWYFNISASKWLNKETFVRPMYPAHCTDDFENIQTNNCTELLWPKPLQRSEDTPFDIMPYSEQPYYWPDSMYGPYFGIFPKGFSSSTLSDNSSLQYSNKAAIGTPLVPYAATGLQQSYRSYLYHFNSTHQATLYEYCTSVFAEPTRGMTLDGVAGRASSPVLIAQPRRQRPGWDGCRDRYDNRTDIPIHLQFVQPSPRYAHRAIYHPNTSEIFVYGGMTYVQDQPKVFNKTYSTIVQADMWYYHLHHCVNNCSFHGQCHYGFCFCDVGYYGVDCSNISCPGTYCYYDDFSHEEICVHACHSGYQHYDNEIYQQDQSKKPCTKDHPGESHGICDGYGHVLCAPPFLTSDCSVRDCKANCSFNGWCSVEYPVSRCMCQPGYYGEICDQLLCLNNCSYPNGVCNSTTGQCGCNMMYSPYNNTRSFMSWQGEDCSYLFAYELGHRLVGKDNIYMVIVVIVIMMLIMMRMNDEDWIERRNRT